MRGLAPLLPALLLLLLTQPWGVAGVLPTGMIEFKSTKGYTYCAGGVRCVRRRGGCFFGGFCVGGLMMMVKRGRMAS